MYFHTYDFGPGFYLTDDIKQAITWAHHQSRSQSALVSVNLSKFLQHVNVLEFKQPSDNFIKYVHYCRICGKFYPQNVNHKYSAVFGPIIDGKLFGYIFRIRFKYLPNLKKLNYVAKHFNLSKFIKISKPRHFFNKTHKGNQLCLIDKTAIKDYISKRDIHYRGV